MSVSLVDFNKCPTFQAGRGEMGEMKMSLGLKLYNVFPNTVNNCSSGPKSNEFRTLADYHPWSRLFLFTSFVTNFRWKRVRL